MKTDGRKEFCRVCQKTSMLRRRSLSPVSTIVLWVYFILGIIVIGKLKTSVTLANIEPVVRIIYIASIIIFAAYDSFVKTLEYRCRICGLQEPTVEKNAKPVWRLFVVASTIFSALLLIAVAIFLVYVFLSF